MITYAALTELPKLYSISKEKQDEISLRQS